MNENQQHRALCAALCEGLSGKEGQQRGRECPHGQFPLPYATNIVKQLCSNKNYFFLIYENK